MSKPDCNKCGRSLNGVSIHYHGRDTVCAQCKIDILTLKVEVLEKQLSNRDSILEQVSRRAIGVYHDSIKAWEQQEFGDQEEVRA